MPIAAVTTGFPFIGGVCNLIYSQAFATSNIWLLVVSNYGYYKILGDHSDIGGITSGRHMGSIAQ